MEGMTELQKSWESKIMKVVDSTPKTVKIIDCYNKHKERKHMWYKDCIGNYYEVVTVVIQGELWYLTHPDRKFLIKKSDCEVIKNKKVS
jgi:hypothetical protein